MTAGCVRVELIDHTGATLADLGDWPLEDGTTGAPVTVASLQLAAWECLSRRSADEATPDGQALDKRVRLLAGRACLFAWMPLCDVAASHGGTADAAGSQRHVPVVLRLEVYDPTTSCPTCVRGGGCPP